MTTPRTTSDERAQASNARAQKRDALFSRIRTLIENDPGRFARAGRLIDQLTQEQLKARRLIDADLAIRSAVKEERRNIQERTRACDGSVSKATLRRATVSEIRLDICALVAHVHIGITNAANAERQIQHILDKHKAKRKHSRNFEELFHEPPTKEWQDSDFFSIRLYERLLKSGHSATAEQPGRVTALVERCSYLGQALADPNFQPIASHLDFASRAPLEERQEAAAAFLLAVAIVGDPDLNDEANSDLSVLATLPWYGDENHCGKYAHGRCMTDRFDYRSGDGDLPEDLLQQIQSAIELLSPVSVVLEQLGNEAKHSDRRPASWFVNATNQVLSADVLRKRVAASPPTLSGSEKVGRRWYHSIRRVCQVYPEHANDILRAEASGNKPDEGGTKRKSSA